MRLANMQMKTRGSESQAKKEQHACVSSGLHIHMTITRLCLNTQQL